MKRNPFLITLQILFLSAGFPSLLPAAPMTSAVPRLGGVFYETGAGRVMLADSLVAEAQQSGGSKTNMPDGRVIHVTVGRDGNNLALKFLAQPDGGILQWGIALDAGTNEYFTGLMERVVDGPQESSWARNITKAMNLRGQIVQMIVKPTLSLYSPFFVSSRGYAVAVQGAWPGQFDFCAGDTQRVKIEFEGPSFEMKIYAAGTPAEVVKAHALDAGPPFLPPHWMYGTWRWRDEHTQRNEYCDGTAVAGPFNSEFMEDVLPMKAYGIPLSVYWLDRPWGPGRLGDDDFEIDINRFPNLAASFKWLNEQDIQMFLWIAPFLQGRMATNAMALGYTIPY
jgi:alpha-glucosidase (family GH31 glycosyl hydrolase)